MAAFLLISLLIALLAVALLGAMMVLKGAFWGEQELTEQPPGGNWRPPFVSGEALRNWAELVAVQVAQKRLLSKRSPETAIQLATELEDGAVRAMLPSARQAALNRIVLCPERGQGMIGVTAPEVLAIAAHIRRHRSRAERKRIRVLALENSKDVSARAGKNGNPGCLVCPLLGQDRVCCVYGVRPLACRALHAMFVAKRTGSSTVPPADFGIEGWHGSKVAQGIQLGLTRVLRASRLDPNVYELNSALVDALESPDAAERWIHGENVFANASRLQLGDISEPTTSTTEETASN